MDALMIQKNSKTNLLTVLFVMEQAGDHSKKNNSRRADAEAYMKTVIVTILTIAILSFPAFAAEQVKIFTTYNYSAEIDGAKELQSAVNEWLKQNSTVTIKQRFLDVTPGSGQIHYAITIFYETKQ